MSTNNSQQEYDRVMIENLHSLTHDNPNAYQYLQRAAELRQKLTNKINEEKVEKEESFLELENHRESFFEDALREIKKFDDPNEDFSKIDHLILSLANILPPDADPLYFKNAESMNKYLTDPNRTHFNEHEEFSQRLLEMKKKKEKKNFLTRFAEGLFALNELTHLTLVALQGKYPSVEAPMHLIKGGFDFLTCLVFMAAAYFDPDLKEKAEEMKKRCLTFGNLVGITAGIMAFINWPVSVAILLGNSGIATVTSAFDWWKASRDNDGSPEALFNLREKKAHFFHNLTGLGGMIVFTAGAFLGGWPLLLAGAIIGLTAAVANYAYKKYNEGQLKADLKAQEVKSDQDLQNPKPNPTPDQKQGIELGVVNKTTATVQDKAPSTAEEYRRGVSFSTPRSTGSGNAPRTSTLKEEGTKSLDTPSTPPKKEEDRKSIAP